MSKRDFGGQLLRRPFFFCLFLFAGFNVLTPFGTLGQGHGLVVFLGGFSCGSVCVKTEAMADLAVCSCHTNQGFLGSSFLLCLLKYFVQQIIFPTSSESCVQ